ncbi:MAG: alpha/beta hydrolase [Spirochaetaceae bacterium]|nr:alpha/beta hydrolase [Spirochaetaceae bacterium]
MTFNNFIFNTIKKSWEKHDTLLLETQQYPQHITEFSSIFYTDKNNPELTLDIYQRQDCTHFQPAIILIHGGGLFYGDKRNNKLFGYELANRGFTIFNINYQTAPKNGKMPQQVEDILLALQWIYKEGINYRANTNQVFLIGDSAGAFLAVTAALAQKDSHLRYQFTEYHYPKMFLPNIAGIILISGMLHFYEKNLALTSWRKHTFKENYYMYPFWKSLQFDTLPEIKLLPPTLLISSEQDPLNAMTFHFEKILQKYKIPYSLFFFKRNKAKKLPHIFPIKYPYYDESQYIISEISHFINAF